MAEKRSLKKVSVKLHREIYKEKAVLAAAQAYAGLAGFRITVKGAYLLAVIIAGGKTLPECLAADFVNRALFNSI